MKLGVKQLLQPVAPTVHARMVKLHFKGAQVTQ
jgi:hypothetical protein